MKAKLEFELPEEQEEFKMATTAGDAYAALIELDTWLRARVKWASEDQPEEATKSYQECRDHLSFLLQEHGVVIF